jgi:hypothetical protein
MRLICKCLAAVLALSPVLPASACSCRSSTEVQLIEAADLVFVGELLKVEGELSERPQDTAHLAARKRQELVFTNVSSVKGQVASQQRVVDVTQYGNACALGPPDLRQRVGQRMRVAAHRVTTVPDWIAGFAERWGAAPIYAISFNLCSKDLAPPEGVQP